MIYDVYIYIYDIWCLLFLLFIYIYNTLWAVVCGGDSSAALIFVLLMYDRSRFSVDGLLSLQFKISSRLCSKYLTKVFLPKCNRKHPNMPNRCVNMLDSDFELLFFFWGGGDSSVFPIFVLLMHDRSRFQLIDCLLCSSRSAQGCAANIQLRSFNQGTIGSTLIRRTDVWSCLILTEFFFGWRWQLCIPDFCTADVWP